MAYLFTQPQALAATAADVAAIGSAVTEAHVTAANPTTSVVAAAADEVSAAAANLFNSYAQQYQGIARQAEGFHNAFTQLLANAGNAYTEAESVASGALGALTAPARTLLAPVTGGAVSVAAEAKAALTSSSPVPVAISLIMEGSGYPTPSQQYIDEVYRLFISPNFTTTNLQGLTTPESLYPLTGTKSWVYDQSLGQGLTVLNNAITQAYHNGITPINVFGFSQSATLASLEMPKLITAGIPSSDVNFVMIGDPMNPNGGMLSRFPDLTVPSFGLTFYGATPTNDYPTVIYTGTYDGYADFPQYPIDVLSDLNSLLGIVAVHASYPTLTTQQVMSAIQLPTSGPTMTTYYMIPTQNLPLLDPLRLIPYVGNPLADLLQPDLTYLINWGYGNPAYGYSTGPADVTTPFGLLPPLSATTALLPDLVSGTQQGIADAANALHAEGLPPLPQLSLSGMSNALAPTVSAVPGTLTLPTQTSATSLIDNIILGLEAANTNIVGGLTAAFSTAYATVLPTTDLVTAGLFTIPSYDTNLFLNGILQAVNGAPLQGLINAIGDPLAATTGLVSIGGAVEFLTLFGAGVSIVEDLSNI